MFLKPSSAFAPAPFLFFFTFLHDRQSSSSLLNQNIFYIFLQCSTIPLSQIWYSTPNQNVKQIIWAHWMHTEIYHLQELGWNYLLEQGRFSSGHTTEDYDSSALHIKEVWDLIKFHPPLHGGILMGPGKCRSWVGGCCCCCGFMGTATLSHVGRQCFVASSGSSILSTLLPTS